MLNQAVAAAPNGRGRSHDGAVGATLWTGTLKQSLIGYGVNAEQVDELSQVSTGVAVIVRVGGDNRNLIWTTGANHW